MTEITHQADFKQSFSAGVQVAWDATSLELASTCPRKYYYSIVRGIQPKELSVHLLFGQIYASSLEHFYRRRAEGESFEDALTSTVHLALSESWDFSSGQAKDFNDTKKTRPNLIRTIIWYLEEYGRETDGAASTYILPSGKPAVELSFTIDPEDDIFFCGHLDRVVEIGSDLYIADQKTTGSSLSAHYFAQFSPNNQMSLYSWAGRIILESPIAGVIIDAAQIAVGFSRFARGITHRTKAQLDEWYNSAIHHIRTTQEITSNARDLELGYDPAAFPMNLSACGNYGGCPFRILCSQAPAIRESYIRSDFTEHNWDPLEAR